jgi:Capsule assembly protein Wzi
MMSRPRLIAPLLLCLLSPGVLWARGVTPYLPLNLDPELEREVERVMVLGGKPVMTRPIPAAAVLDALPKACAIDAELCGRVRRALKRYMQDTGLEFLSAEAAATRGAKVVMPNQHGQTEQSPWQLAGAGYIQPSDYLLVNVGGLGYDGRETPTGSFVSLGFDWAQLDVGYRDRWWSPMTDSSMLVSTEAPTMPSITLSNYRPLARLGWQYEVFLARMSESDKIELTNGELTRGYPKFAGVRLGIEPGDSGWSLSGNRIVVFGGGAAGGQSLTNVLEAFFNPTKAQTTGFGTVDVIGKQEASITSRFVYPGRIPFSIYFEYAGNDPAGGNRLLFSRTDLSVGVTFPRLGPFDLTYEVSGWQPTWYIKSHSNVQTGYGDGITNYLLSIGHWFGDQRLFGDAVGGESHMVRLGFEPLFTGRLEATLRALVNDPYYHSYPSAVAYKHEYMGSLSYSYPWKNYIIGSEIDYGRDVFGAHYTRFAAFLRFGDGLHAAEDAENDEPSGYTRPEHAEFHIDAGVAASRVLADITTNLPRTETRTGYGPHLTIGARNAVTEHQDLGAAVEVDGVHGVSLFGARLLDYRYRFGGPIALNLFAGAARYAAATPAYGAYFGGGLQWREILPHWDVGIDYRYATKVDRLRTLPTDPQGGYRPDAYYDISVGTLYISRKF